MEPGTILGGRFRLGAHLERSRRGEVFDAQDETNGDAACRVELITYSGFVGDDIEALAEREVTIRNRLDLPGLIGAVGWGRLGPDRLFVARAVMPGTAPLNLSSGSLPDRLRLVLKVAERVATLHEVGAVHRDLSPLTVLLGPGPADVWLSGLGLVRLEGVDEPPLDVRGQQVSYLPCAAPELLDAPEDATPATDVFALGVLLHQAMAGVPPFPGPTLADLIRQHEEVRWGRRPLPPGPDATIPKPILEVCRRSLPIDPTLRFKTAAVMAAALEEALKPLGAPEPTEVVVVEAPDPDPTPGLDPAQTPSADQRRLLSEALGERAEEERLAALSDLINAEEEPAPAEAQVTSGLDTQKLWDPFESDDRTDEEEPDSDEVMAAESFSLEGPAAPSPEEPIEVPAEEAPEPKPEPKDEGLDTMMLRLELPQNAVESWKPATSRFKRAEVEAEAKAPPSNGDTLEETAVNEGPDLEVTNVVDEPASRGEPTEEVEVSHVAATASPESDLLSMIPALELEPIEPAALEPPAPEEDEEEEEPEALSPEEALAALEAVTREVDLVPLHPPPATNDEVLEAFGPSDDAPAASPDEVLSALGLTDSGIEDASTDVVAALPETPDGLDRTASGRFDLGSLDLTESEIALMAAEPPLTAAAPPPSVLPLPPLPTLPALKIPEPEPVELLPPVAFSNLAAHGKALVLSIPAKDYAPAVDCAHRVDPAGFELFLLDMSKVARVGGRQLEDLTAILTHADRKEIRTAMFGLRADVRQLIDMMAGELGAQNMPSALAAQDLESALAEVQVQG